MAAGEATAKAARGGRNVFVVAFFVGLAVTLVGWRAQGFVDTRPDPYAYEAMAKSLLRGEGFEGFGSVLNRRGPGYPVFIAFVYLITGIRPLAVQVAQCILFAGTCALAHDLGRRLFNPRTGTIAAFACALHPGLLRYVPDFHLEILLAFLVTLCVWFSVRLTADASLKWAALFGVTAGIASLVKPVVLLYPLVVVAYLGIRYWMLGGEKNTAPPIRTVRPQNPGAVLVVLLLASALVVAPWTARNYVLRGKLIPVTTGVGDAILRSYHFTEPDFITLRRPPYTDAENACNAEFRALCAAKGTVWERDDVESDRILTAEAKSRVLSNPAAFVKKSFVGLFTFWYQMTGRTNSLVVGAWAALWWALALFGWRRARQERRETWPLWLLILYLNVALALLLALGRYSVPVLPLLTVLAAFGLDSLLPASKRAGAG